jgi:hypothetical protein
MFIPSLPHKPLLTVHSQEHTLLCLIAKGVHLEGYAKVEKSDDPSAARGNAYLTFATTLNDSLHGTDYEHDIHKKEVTRKLDHVLLKHKAIVGKGGLAARQHGSRVTRLLRLAWLRSTGRTSEFDVNLGRYRVGVACPLDFDGSISEWNQWRRMRVENKRRAKLGLPVIEGIDEQRQHVGIASSILDHEIMLISKQSMSSNRIRVVSPAARGASST